MWVLTRAEIEQKLVELTQLSQDSNVIKEQIKQWMINKKCSDLEISQILNDLTSYQVYLEVMNK